MAESDTWPDTQLPSAELLMRLGPSSGQRFQVTRPTIAIGRRAENDVIVADHEVSGRHASLAWDGSRWTIQDLGSANGTYLNGVRLSTSQVLRDGDLIGLGPNVQLSFQSAAVGAGPPPDTGATIMEALPSPPDTPSVDQAAPPVAAPLADAGATIAEPPPSPPDAPSPDQAAPTGTPPPADTGATIAEALPSLIDAPGADQAAPPITPPPVDTGATIAEAPPSPPDTPGVDQVAPPSTPPPADAEAAIAEARPSPAVAPGPDQAAPTSALPPADTGATIAEALPSLIDAPSADQAAPPSTPPPADTGATIAEALPSPPGAPGPDQVGPPIVVPPPADTGATIAEAPPSPLDTPSPDQIAPPVTTPPADTGATITEALPSPPDTPRVDQVAAPVLAPPPADTGATIAEALPSPPDTPSVDQVAPPIIAPSADAGATSVEALPPSSDEPSAGQVAPPVIAPPADTGATMVEALPAPPDEPSAGIVAPPVIAPPADTGATIVEALPRPPDAPSADRVAPPVMAPPADAGATMVEPMPLPRDLPRPAQVKAVPSIPIPAQKRRRRRLVLPLLAAGLVVACLLVGALAAYPLWPRRSDSTPVVLIELPPQGEQIPVGQQVAIHAVAWDADGVVRVELWVNGQLQEAQASSLPLGNSPFPLLAYWQPLSAGPHTLTARAFDATGGRAQASLIVEAIAPTDRDSPGDGDSDGVADAKDACPEVWGLAEHGGCPDRDRDNVSDIADRSLDQAERSDEEGVLGTGDDDDDSDGVAGDQDSCPDEPGLPEHGGCPPPDPSEDADGDGTPDEEERAAHPLGPLGLLEIVATDSALIEIQALDLDTAEEYDHLSCYARLASGEIERYDLKSLGGRRWDIAAYLGRRLVAVPPGEALVVQAQCYGHRLSAVAGQPLSLGSFSNQHRPEEWAAGGEISAESVGGEEGRWFRLTYRLCTASCEQSLIPAPALTLQHLPNRTLLIWQWEADQSALDGFWLHVDGNLVDRLVPGQSAQDVNKYAPACGEAKQFYMTAFRGHPFYPDEESPSSNLVVWEGGPCTRTVLVTFDELITHSLSGLQDGEEAGRIAGSAGPIRGDLWVQGTSRTDIAFDAADGLQGYYLQPDDSHSIQEILDWVRGEQGAEGYYAPPARYATVQLGPDDDLTIGASILDEDGQSYQWIFRAFQTIAAEEIAPGSYTIEDSIRGTVLLYRIEVLESP